MTLGDYLIELCKLSNQEANDLCKSNKQEQAIETKDAVQKELVDRMNLYKKYAGKMEAISDFLDKEDMKIKELKTKYEKLQEEEKKQQEKLELEYEEESQVDESYFNSLSYKENPLKQKIIDSFLKNIVNNNDFNNLLKNAAKYKDGGFKLELELELEVKPTEKNEDIDKEIEEIEQKILELVSKNPLEFTKQFDNFSELNKKLHNLKKDLYALSIETEVELKPLKKEEKEEEEDCEDCQCECPCNEDGDCSCCEDSEEECTCGCCKECPCVNNKEEKKEEEEVEKDGEEDEEEEENINYEKLLVIPLSKLINITKLQNENDKIKEYLLKHFDDVSEQMASKTPEELKIFFKYSEIAHKLFKKASHWEESLLKAFENYLFEEAQKELKQVREAKKEEKDQKVEKKAPAKNKDKKDIKK